MLENPASQQPSYPDQQALDTVVSQLEAAKPLVEYDRVAALSDQLGRVANREAFLLQAGSCTESLSHGRAEVHGLMDVVLPMTTTLMYAAGMPVVKIGRVAGQYTKPRSADTEVKGGIALPSFRGESVNGPAFNEEDRTPDPERMLKAYRHSAQMITILSELAEHGYSDLENAHEWNQRLLRNAPSESLEEYQEIIDQVSRAIRFMKAAGIDVANMKTLHEASIFTSHEALLLPYELALIRQAESGELYDSSAHQIWIGERTRQINGAHVELATKVVNPRAVKVGPSIDTDELLELVEKLNPDNTPGRLTLISRMGKDHIRTELPRLMRATKAAGAAIVWACDPMHGNTITHGSHKTRRFEDIVAETNSFFDVADETGEWPGGLHIEATGDNVTECIGGSVDEVLAERLADNYLTLVDPRLNQLQSLELGLLAAKRLAEFA